MARARRCRLSAVNHIAPRATAETLLMVAAVTGLGLASHGRVPISAMDLLYLVPVMVAARLHGLGQGVIAGIASALAYNFFFVEPLHTLRIDDTENTVTVIALLAVAVFTSRLTAQLRSQARDAETAANRNAALAAFARQLGTAVQYEAIEVVVYRLRKKLADTGLTLMTLRGLGYLIRADT